MTTRYQPGPVPRQLIAVAACAALLAQMALPALHAFETRDPSRPASLGWHTTSAAALAFERAARAAPTHDPSTCPVCRCLTRTNPVASAWISRGELPREHGLEPPVAPVFDHSTVAQSGHPPRAPPARVHATIG